MRGVDETSGSLFSYVDLEERNLYPTGAFRFWWGATILRVRGSGLVFRMRSVIRGRPGFFGLTLIWTGTRHRPARTGTFMGCPWQVSWATGIRA